MTEWICPEAVTTWAVRRKCRKAGKESAKGKTKRKSHNEQAELHTFKIIKLHPS